MALELEGVTKTYKNGRGVRDISFALAPGEVLGLLGPNGSGKTTIMKAVVGIVFSDCGDIRVCGIDAIAHHEDAMRHASCLIESPALHEYLTPLQNLELAAKFYKDIDKARIDEVLHMVSMYEYRKDKVSSLSLGMRQRIGLALAFISRPRLLILDEPANGLDIEGMLYVREVVKAVAANGSAVLMSSHLASEIQHCATKAAVIHSGKLLDLKSMDEILLKHNDLEEFFLAQVEKTRRDVAV